MDNLLNGIYFISFKSSLRDFGNGLIVASKGTIHGGDHSYLYIGTYSSYESTIIAKINVKHYRGDVDSIFGPLKSFNLELKGSGTEASFSLEGKIIGSPNLTLTLTGTKVSPVINPAIDI